MRIVIAGGPYCGKTTLVGALKDAGFEVISEAALAVISEEQENGNMTPWQGRAHFQKKILELQVHQFNQTHESVLVFDRGIPDGIAYYYLDGLSPPDEALHAAKKYTYDVILIPELLDEYIPGVTRGETLEERERVHKFIKKSYEDLGYNPIIIPKGSVQERVLFVKKVIKNLEFKK